MQRLHRRVAQQRDDGDEELRPHHVHLGVAVEHIHDAGVVQLALGLQQRHQHRVLAALFIAVLVQLFQEVFVALLGGRLVALVLHLEHDRDDLVARLVHVAKDEVTLAAAARVVVLLKVRTRKRRGADAVELRLAVLLQRLAHHLGRKARLHVPEPRNLAVAVAQLQGVLLLDGVFFQLLFHHHQVQVVFQFIALAGHHRHRLGHRQPARHLGRLQL